MDTESTIGQVAENFNRFKGAPWFSKIEDSLIVGGAGGIGSWLSLFLSRAGFPIFVYDFDIYEKHNMGGQFCNTFSVGTPKVEALATNIYDYADVFINTRTAPYDKDGLRGPYMFSGFDNMEARKVMFNNWLDYISNKENLIDEEGNPIEPIFIDGRLLAEQFEIYCVRNNPQDIEDYKKLLFSDDEIEEADCTLKQTSHIAAMIGSYMVGFFTNHITNMLAREEIRHVPFSYFYFLPLNLVEVDKDKTILEEV